MAITPTAYSQAYYFIVWDGTTTGNTDTLNYINGVTGWTANIAGSPAQLTYSNEYSSFVAAVGDYILVTLDSNGNPNQFGTPLHPDAMKRQYTPTNVWP